MRAVLLSLLVGCCPTPWGRSEVTVSGSVRFRSAVTQAVDNWDEAMFPRCDWPVFTIVEEGGWPVRETSEWTDTEHSGYWDGSEIVIKSPSGEELLKTCVHELGHAIGLDHVKWWDEADSVMVEGPIVVNVHPSPRDVERAAHELGCP